MSRSGAHSSQIMVIDMIFMLDICREARDTWRLAACYPEHNGKGSQEAADERLALRRSYFRTVELISSFADLIFERLSGLVRPLDTLIEGLVTFLDFLL